MTVYRSIRWAGALTLVMAGMIGLGAATAPAAPAARTSTSAFELTAEATQHYTFVFSPQGGTFRSRAPFCETGKFDPGVFPGITTWRFTCDDGTGSLAVSFPDPWPNRTWRVVVGTGLYAGLRGKGSLREESLPCERCDEKSGWPWRGTLQGVFDDREDAVAPSVAFTSATVKKLRRPVRAYAVKLRLALRDDVPDNPVSYTVRACAYTVDACAGRLELARSFGTATTGAVSLTLRIRRPVASHNVQLQVTAEDPGGNTVSISRAVWLPR